MCFLIVKSVKAKNIFEGLHLTIHFFQDSRSFHFKSMNNLIENSLQLTNICWENKIDNRQTMDNKIR